MRYYKAMPLAFLLLYLAAAFLIALGRVDVADAVYPAAEFGEELGQEFIQMAMAILVVFLIAFLVALALAALLTTLLRRDRWWIGSIVVFLVFIAPTLVAVLPLDGGTMDAWVGDCHAVIAGQVTACGAKLENGARMRSLLWSLGSAVLYWLDRRTVVEAHKPSTFVTRTSVMLTTERLTLVPHRPEHFAAYAEFWSRDPGQFLRHLAPMHPSDAWTRLLKHFGHWTAFGWGPFLGFDRAGKLVLEAGYEDFRRDVGPRFDGVPEGLWKVDLAEQGKGYAGEAMAAITGWLDMTPHSQRTVCMIDPENTASIRVASRLGFREFDSIEYRGSAVNLYERVR